MIVDYCRRDNGIVVMLWKYYFEIVPGHAEEYSVCVRKGSFLRRSTQKSQACRVKPNLWRSHRQSLASGQDADQAAKRSRAPRSQGEDLAPHL